MVSKMAILQDEQKAGRKNHCLGLVSTLIVVVVLGETVVSKMAILQDEQKAGRIV